MDGAAIAAGKAAARRGTRMVRMHGAVATPPPKPAPASHGGRRVPDTDTTAANAVVAQLGVRERDFVKIRRQGEGFWCNVTACLGEVLEVEVGNDLVHNPELPFGSPLRINLSDVEDIMKPEDCTTFGELLERMFASAPAARPVEERWATACIEAQMAWAQHWRSRVDRGSS